MPRIISYSVNNLAEIFFLPQESGIHQSAVKRNNSNGLKIG